MTWQRILTVWAILPAAATLYFYLFWTYFEFWRSRRRLWMVMLGLTFLVGAGLAVALHRWTFAARIHFPLAVVIAGWFLLAVICIFGTIADRQIGLRVRSFAPFFDDTARITLKTTGAYGIVRHPIYAAGSWFQLALFGVTGYPSILVAWVIFTLGALWFTKREEEKLMTLLDDPSEYDLYRERVPALFPSVRRAPKR